MANKSRRPSGRKTQFGAIRNHESSFFTPFSSREDRKILSIIVRDLRARLSPDSPFFHCANSVTDLFDFVGRDYDHSSHRPLDDIRRDRQLLALFSKSVSSSLSSSEDRRNAALSSFRASERKCKVTNLRLGQALESDGFPSDVESLLYRIRRKISSILGPVPSYDSLCCQFGNGASSNVRKITSVRHKLDSTLTCSSNVGEELAPFLSSYLGFTYAHASVEIGYGQYDTVPKNAKTDRSIVMEPSLNTFVQKGIGSYMKDRLLRFGCNLYDQSVNQRLAKVLV